MKKGQGRMGGKRRGCIRESSKINSKTGYKIRYSHSKTPQGKRRENGELTNEATQENVFMGEHRERPTPWWN